MPLITRRADRAPLQRLVRRVPVSDQCIDYAMDLVRATRGLDPPVRSTSANGSPGGPGRAGQALILASKARQRSRVGRASLWTTSRRWPGRSSGTGSCMNYNAQAAGETSDSIIKELLADIPVRKGAADAAVADVFRS